MATCSIVGELVQSVLEFIFIALMGFQPSIEREELTLAVGTNSKGWKCWWENRRAGAGWKNLARNGQDGAEEAFLCWAGDLWAGW